MGMAELCRVVRDACGVAPSDDARRAATRAEVLSDVDPVVLEVWKLKGRKVGAMLRESQEAVIELQEKLENHPDAGMLDFIAAEYLDLLAFSMPTGQGDADVGWKLQQHRMGEAKPSEVSCHYRDDLRAAIREAMLALGYIAPADGVAASSNDQQENGA